MNDYEIQRRLRMIREVADDYEAAHCLEDDLHRDVLRAIAEADYTVRLDIDPGSPVDKTLTDEIQQIRALCRSALESLDIDFPRHCA